MGMKSKRPGAATYRNADRPILKAYLKHCPGCDVVKDRDEFYRYSRAADGKQSRCKACMKIKANE